uniref:Uncharacterized protein n=1 Tax=Oryza brachyantha TaxID=4533 RepID=J3M5N2_ORYBR
MEARMAVDGAMEAASQRPWQRASSGSPRRDNGRNRTPPDCCDDASHDHACHAPASAVRPNARGGPVPVGGRTRIHPEGKEAYALSTMDHREKERENFFLLPAPHSYIPNVSLISNPSKGCYFKGFDEINGPKLKDYEDKICPRANFQIGGIRFLADQYGALYFIDSKSSEFEEEVCRFVPDNMMPIEDKIQFGSLAHGAAVS